MSSTNRGGKREASDYYATPVEPIELFLREWAKDCTLLHEVNRILDPCAGGKLERGEVTQSMAYPLALSHCQLLFPSWDARWQTMDIRGDSCADIVRDYLGSEPGRRPDLIISNPPFCLAMEFIEKALRHVRPGGFVVFLLRLNFFGSAKRKALMQSNPPARCYVHSERMSFTGGQTDSIEYMHAVWRAGYKATETKLRVI